MNSSIPKKVVLIGASTGGPGQIQKIIKSLPNLLDTSIIIAQHMASGFTESFAKNLQLISTNPIHIVRDKQPCQSNNIYICEGFVSLKRVQNSLLFSHQLSSTDRYNPDINILFNSLVPLCNSVQIMSIILTGIGSDGADACKNLSLHGARCLTESAQSAIIDGMPSRVREEVKDVEIYDVEEIIKKISEFCQNV